MDSLPFLSIIVPAYNSEKTIESCLKAIRSSDYREYELLVIDDGSRDQTGEIAKKYADRILGGGDNRGRVSARNEGIRSARGEIIVNVDSDVLLRPDSLSQIAGYFIRHPDVSALTGLLSGECVESGFFSRYKNLYMNYIFKQLPERVSFLYGSIYAVRRREIEKIDSSVELADDTELGQELFSKGKRIAFLKDLEVTHLKRYTLFSFLKNDFQIPFDWARIFIRNQAWHQLGKNKTGFAHSPKSQIASVVLVPFMLLTLPLIFKGFGAVFGLAFLLWIALNFKFISFLVKEKGLIFGSFAFGVTLMDNLIMAAGIFFGFLVEFSSPNRKPKGKTA